jgi:hypothetical protein
MTAWSSQISVPAKPRPPFWIIEPIMKLDHTMEMAYPQKVARDIIIGMTRPINQHLIKLVGFGLPDQSHTRFRRELRDWLDEIQRIRLKPTTRTRSFKFYFDPLFDYPFGGVEVQNMRALIDFISGEYEGIRSVKTPEELVEWLREFHTELAQPLHDEENVLDLIPE